MSKRIAIRRMFEANEKEVERLVDAGNTINQVARHFKVYDHSLRSWVEAARPDLKAKLVANGRRRISEAAQNFRRGKNAELDIV